MMGTLDKSQLWQLVLFRLRFFLREPGAFFWSFAAPLGLTLLLGAAFQDRTLDDVPIAVVDAPGAEKVLASLRQTEGAAPRLTTLEHGQKLLSRSQVALVVEASAEGRPNLYFDPSRDDGRVARLMVLTAMERSAGVRPTIKAVEHKANTPGTRYIDFVLPGLLAHSLMSTSLYLVGGALMSLRDRKLLKRFGASPLRQTAFLGSFLASRGIVALVEIGAVTLTGALLFGVPMVGNLFAYVGFALYGALCIAGIGMMMGAISAGRDTINGISNIGSMLMMMVSGVFFATDRFPEWTQPIIKALPLTAMVDGMRGIMRDGMTLVEIWPQTLVLALWGVLPALYAFKYFRWN